jgi:hypothetical protein
MARISIRMSMAVLAVAALGLSTAASAQSPPGTAAIHGQKVLTLILRDPPGVRCNNNIQVAAEIANLYKIPIQIIPVSVAGPGVKAPAVYYGKELLAVDGGAFNGMVSYAMIEGVLEVEDAPKQATKGRLMEVKPDFERLKAAIKAP